MTPALFHYTILASVLFGIGLVGLVLRRNLLTMLLCVELMVNAANLVFVAAARHWGTATGHVLVLFTIAVAACEAAVGLAIAVNLYRLKDSVDPNELNALKN